IPLRRRLRLLAGDERQPCHDRLQIDESIVPFPDHVFARAPRPSELRRQGPYAFAPKRPDLDVLPRAVESIELYLPGLLDLEDELRLEAISGLVAHECQVPARFGHLHVD